jgi:hypothetical protein
MPACSRSTYQVWSSTLASGALILTDAIPASREASDL